MDKKIDIIIQHFHGCPNGPKMIDSLKQAILGYEDKISFSELIIDTPELAKKYNFRGSPTLLIQGIDIEGMPAPEDAALTCRFYPDGLPSSGKIRNKIKNLIDKEIDL